MPDRIPLSTGSHVLWAIAVLEPTNTEDVAERLGVAEDAVAQQVERLKAEQLVTEPSHDKLIVNVER